MANKSASTASSSASNDAFSELEQLRLIVFGEAKQNLENKLDELHQRVSDENKAMQTQIDERFDTLTQTMADNQSALLEKLNALDEHTQNDKAELVSAIDSLSSELEMADNAAKDEAQALHKRLDQEVDDIHVSLKQAVNDLSEQLNSMNTNLASSKTDRKILAKLLANVATNLDADE